jgi:hypothetical protein
VVLVSVACVPGMSAGADLYVSTAGRDAWSGRLADPSADGSDGPLATVKGAQAQVRAIRGRAGPAEPVTVHIRAGRYELTEPLLLTPADSGTADAPVTYQAYAAERPVISGGRILTGWTVDAAGRWQLRLPQVERGEWSFSQLFVNGERRYRPRLPKDGYFLIARQVHPTEANAARGWDRFGFDAGQVRSDWHNLTDVEVLAFHDWSMSHLRIKSVDETARIVTLTGPSPNIADWAALGQGDRYIIENVAEALSEPGEWYLDRQDGRLTYVPMPGETPESAIIVAPAAEQLLVLKGDAASGKPIDHLVFRGLTFEHTNWVTPPQGYAFVQAELPMPAAISAEGVRECVLEDCTVRSVGGYAISLGPGSQGNSIERCDLLDLGAGGIRLGDSDNRDGAPTTVSRNTIRDTLIAHGGRTHPAGIGVLLSNASHNTIENCQIADFYYTGVSMGWSWGYAPSATHHNIVANNHIHDIGQAVLSDMGGIYTLGVSPGSVLCGNRIHDVKGYDYGGWGIYFDEGSTDILAEQNIVYRTGSAPFHQHYGRNNKVANNIFSFGGEAQLMRSRPEEHLSFTLERNIVYWNAGPLLGGNWTGDTSRFALDRNLYWNTGGPVLFAGKTLAQWQAGGQDVHSIVADPLFADATSGDFALRAGSPASRIGFVPIDGERAGLLTPRDADSAAPAFPLKLSARPAATIGDDFEQAPIGSKALGATTSEENEQATIRVAADPDGGGGKCLKFVDAPGQKQGFNPHLFYAPRLETGVVEGRFRLWLEPGASLSHEWRTWPAGGTYHAGPSITIGGDGVLQASGVALGKAPAREWLTLSITCPLGPAAGTYRLRITRADGRALAVRADLPCAKEFRRVDWFGFVAPGDSPAVLYLDDIAIAPKSAP